MVCAHSGVLIPLLVASFPPLLSAQTPPVPADTTATPKIVAGYQNKLTVLVPTVIWLATTVPPIMDSATAELHDVAEPLGFQVVTRIPRHLVIFDARYAGIYYLPESVREGYVVISPGRRPLVLSRQLSATVLRERLYAYRRH